MLVGLASGFRLTVTINLRGTPVAAAGARSAVLS